MGFSVELNSDFEAPIRNEAGPLESYTYGRIMLRLENSNRKIKNLTDLKAEWEDILESVKEEETIKLLTYLNVQEAIVIDFDNGDRSSALPIEELVEKFSQAAKNNQLDHRLLYNYSNLRAFTLVFVKIDKSYLDKMEAVRLDPVQEFVDDINNVLSKNETLRTRIVTVTPVWRSRAAPTDGTVGSGGPGSLPFPLSEDDYDQETKNRRQPIPNFDGRKVRIYILDTLYPVEWEERIFQEEQEGFKATTYEQVHPAQMNDGTRRWWRKIIAEKDEQGNRRNWVRIKDVYKTIGIDENLIEKDENEGLYHDFEGLRQYQNSEVPTYILYDHGPFITDIVFRKAPNAELVLVETLNRYAAGDLITFASVMKWLRIDMQRLLQEDPNYVFVVNCSYTFSLNKDAYAPEAANKLADFATLLMEMLPLSVPDFLDKVVIMAASGNDTLPWIKAKSPALPALLPGVIGVGALSNPDDILRASYSNITDCGYKIKISKNGILSELNDQQGTALRLLKFGSHTSVEAEKLKMESEEADISIFEVEEIGIGAFGGELELEAMPNRMMKVRGGVVGPYLAIPPYAAYSTGFAQWCGTSFATAYATARVAELLLYGDIYEEIEVTKFVSPWTAIEYIFNGVKLFETYDSALNPPSESNRPPSKSKGFYNEPRGPFYIQPSIPGTSTLGSVRSRSIGKKRISEALNMEAIGGAHVSGGG